MKKILYLTFYIIFYFSYSFVMANEEAPYKVVHATDIYEIRHYSDRFVVQASMNVNKNDSSSFRKLFNYISGANSASQEIKMTVPVTQMKKNNEIFMQFYLPSKFSKETIPNPSNPDLEIAMIKEGYFAVIKFSGRSSDKNFIKHSQILYQELLKDQISMKGSPIKATYNSPFTLPPLRRNEAMFEVEWK